MRSRFLLIVGLIAFIYASGCSTKNIEVPEAKDYDETLKLAWSDYDNFNFENALGRFDTVVNYDVSYSYALLGLGWTYGQMGQKDEAISYLNLTVTSLTNTPPIRPVFKWHPPIANVSLITPFFDTTLQLVEIKVPDEYRPILGLLKFHIVGDVRNWKLYYFTDSTLALKPEYLDSTEYPSLFDSLYIDFLTLNADAYDSILYSAYAGLSSAYSMSENYTNSISAALVVLKLKPDFEFSHYPFTRARDIAINLASDYLSYGLNFNAVSILESLDSTWSFDYNNIKLYSVKGMEEILKEINKLKGLSK